MGGGTSYRATYYGKKRKAEVSVKAIKRTGKAFGMDLKMDVPSIKVYNSKTYEQKFGTNSAGNYLRSSNEIRLKREYFAGKKTQNVITHEIFHSHSGGRSGNEMGRIIEEGSVEYLTQYTSKNSFHGRASKYAGGYHTYDQEVKAVTKISKAIGQKNFFKYWKAGLDNPTTKSQTKKNSLVQKHRDLTSAYNKASSQKQDQIIKEMIETRRRINYFKPEKNFHLLVKDLKANGYKRTANFIKQNYDSYGGETKYHKSTLNTLINQDESSIKK